MFEQNVEENECRRAYDMAVEKYHQVFKKDVIPDEVRRHYILLISLRCLRHPNVRFAFYAKHLQVKNGELDENILLSRSNQMLTIL